jgi:phosphate transport system protein
MQETRHRFHRELSDLEHELLAEGEDAATAVALSVAGLVSRDPDVANRVIAGDDAIDRRYMDIEARILEVLALQTPVASDLRLVSSILHVNLHLERIGDQAVNVAKMSLATADLPRDGQILVHLREMGDIVTRMVRVALDAFARRDLGLCLGLPAMDDPVDILNRNMYRQVVALGGGDPAMLEWGIRMNVVARQLERVGDNAVDIGEQVGFLLTGEFREFTDASHDDARDR